MLNVAGVVSIPGMMTGQILGGNPPMVAARYQILILFLICATNVMGSSLVVFFSVSALFDETVRYVQNRSDPRKRESPRKTWDSAT